MRIAAITINGIAILIGLMSFYGMWAAVADLSSAIGWWAIPAILGAFAPWVWLWFRVARHLRRLPEPDPRQQAGIDGGMLDRPMQSLALVLLLTTPLFVYLFVRGLMV